MATPPIASTHCAHSARGTARYRRIRTASAIAGAAALIAAGGSLTATTIRTGDARPTAAGNADVNPSTQTLGDMLQSIAGQYGRRSAIGADVNPGAQTLRELHQSVAGQYGSRSEPGSTVNPNARVQRELRRSIAGQYGPAPSSLTPFAAPRSAASETLEPPA